jgi:hypothetical protein
MPEEPLNVTIEYQREEMLMTPEGVAKPHIITQVSHYDYGVETIILRKDEYSEERLKEEIRKWIERVRKERAQRRTISL